MSRPKQSDDSVTTNAFSVSRKDSGYYITKHTIKDGKVISSQKISEPDVLMICMSTLDKFIRKENGI